MNQNDHTYRMYYDHTYRMYTNMSEAMSFQAVVCSYSRLNFHTSATTGNRELACIFCLVTCVMLEILFSKKWLRQHGEILSPFNIFHFIVFRHLFQQHLKLAQ